MFPAAIALIILLGAGGTVAASDSAKPGDFLFPVDRATERVRLAVAGEDGKRELRARFAQERLDEVRDIIESEDETDGAEEATTSSPDTEEDEAGDTAPDERTTRISEGVAYAIDLIAELDESEEHEALTDELQALLDELPDGTELDVKLSDSGSNFVKVRSKDESNRLNVEVKETGGGKVVIKTRDGKNRLKVEVEDDGRTRVEKKEDNRGKNKDEDDEHGDEDNEDEAEGTVSDVNVSEGTLTLESGISVSISGESEIKSGDYATLAEVAAALAADVVVKAEVKGTYNADESVLTAETIKFESDESDDDNEDEEDEEDDDNDDDSDDKDEEDDD